MKLVLLKVAAGRWTLLLAMLLAATQVQADGKADADIDALPNLTTSTDPLSPIYANAGANLRTGVGSIFIEFEGIAEGGFICTASAITATHILTAAHCVRETNDSVRRIRFILSAGLAKPILIDARAFAVHPFYDFFQPVYGAFAHGDLAVIELAAALPAGIEVYELYRDTDELNQTVRHYGHGRSGNGKQGAVLSAEFFSGRTGLNRYEQTLEAFLQDGVQDQLLSDFDSGGAKHNAMDWWFSPELCHPANPNTPAQAQNGRCTTIRGNIYPDKGYKKLEVGVAPGDSGGPGFIAGKIAGVHSFGFTHFCEGITNGTDRVCGLQSSHGEMSGDTRVSFHAGWIDAVTTFGADTPVPELLGPVSANSAAQTVAPAVLTLRGRAFVDNVVAATLRATVPAR